MLGKDQMKKALVCFSIEQTLIEFNGDTALDTVNEQLAKKFSCSLIDTYDNPQYLVRALKCLYSHSCDTIIKSIIEKLIDFSYQQPISEFLKQLEDGMEIK